MKRKSSIAALQIFDFIRMLRNRLVEYRGLFRWYCEGRPFPLPPIPKRKLLIRHAQEKKWPVFIETGTYMGDTLAALKDYFKDLFSIELSLPLHERAMRRFTRHPQIHLLHGDSGVILPQVLEGIPTPCLFWLDGHFSGSDTARAKLETPIISEMQAILRRNIKGDRILIDDIRLFKENGAGGYPTIDALEKMIYTSWPQCHIQINQDIMRIDNL